MLTASSWGANLQPELLTGNQLSFTCWTYPLFSSLGENHYPNYTTTCFSFFFYHILESLNNTVLLVYVSEFEIYGIRLLGDILQCPLFPQQHVPEYCMQP